MGLIYLLMAAILELYNFFLIYLKNNKKKFVNSFKYIIFEIKEFPEAA